MKPDLQETAEPPGAAHGLDDPVVVGGVGGSGTRLIAQCLQALEYFIGADLNDACDNLWFTLLFKRFGILSTPDAEFDELVRILVIAMTGDGAFSAEHIALVNRLAATDRDKYPAAWLRQRAETLLSKSTGARPGGKWGWKEPNSHIVLDRLVPRLGRLKYIHVTRNGLDMAHSGNQQQLRLWGPHFIREPFSVTPYYALKYWCIVHRRVLDIGKSMGRNFLFLNYDDFCLNPRTGAETLCRFLGLDTGSPPARLAGLIRPPESIGRFKRHGTHIFAADDVEYVRSLGFDVACR